jgi:Predicted metal-dependent enzyme of the double-stranded beta helix superfamily
MTADFLLPQCRGGTRLIEQLDRAVQAGNAGEVAAAVERVLLDAIADPGIELPSVIREPVEGHYARREIYRSAAHGYSVIAMTWAPHQGTPLHDHDGLWCVDGVWQGDLQVTQYELLEEQPQRARFRVVGTIPAGPRQCRQPDPAARIPRAAEPQRRHRGGVGARYQAPMEHCTVFLPEGGDGWFRREEKLLLVDDAC